MLNERSVPLGTHCGIISAIVFDDEQAFCGFNHVKVDFMNEGIRRRLWDALLHVHSGKNVFALVPAERVNAYHEKLGFHASGRGPVLHGKLPFAAGLTHFSNIETPGVEASLPNLSLGAPHSPGGRNCFIVPVFLRDDRVVLWPCHAESQHPRNTPSRPKLVTI